MARNWPKFYIRHCFRTYSVYACVSEPVNSLKAGNSNWKGMYILLEHVHSWI